VVKKTARAKSRAKKARKARKPAKKKAATKSRGRKVKVKSRLKKSQLKEFRQMLLEKRRELVGDMDIEAGSMRTNRQEGSGDLSNMPTHPADIGTDSYEHEFTLGLLESERVLLEKINAALERIDNGTYGICLGTGKPISLARLRARPWARYCIEFTRQLEKGLVQEPDGQDSEED